MIRLNKKYVFISSIIIIILLYLPKFHKPPIEFMTVEMRLIIELTFFIAIDIFAIYLILLTNKEKWKILPRIISSILIIFTLFGFLVTIFNGGNTYIDKKIYVSSDKTDVFISQYHGHGAFGSSTRYVRVKEISKSIRIINYVDFDDIHGEWYIYNLKGEYIESFIFK